MKKLALIILSLTLMACAMAEPISQSIRGQATLDPVRVAAEGTAAAAAVATEQALPAGAPTASPAPTPWTVEFIQDGAAVAPQGDVYRLKKAPFTIRMTFNQSHGEALPSGIFLNAQETDAYYQRVQVNSVLVQDPGLIEADPANFMMGGGAEPSQPGGSGALYVDQANGWISSYFYHYSAEETRWNRVNVVENGVVFERDMTGVMLVDAQGNVQEAALADYPAGRLYLVILLDYPDSPIVYEHELKKAVLEFE